MRIPMTILACVLFSSLGCSDDVAPTPDVTGVLDKGTADLGAADKPAADKGVLEASPIDQAMATGKATDLKLLLHDNLVKVVLASMTVVGKDETTFDLSMTHGDPVDKLPHIELGSGVTAQNLGSTTTFHALTAAPTTGYAADDPTKSVYVIGSSWRGGGSGTTGFVMTKNIYAIKLADGTYAKIEVLSAKGGEVHILAYRQPKVGDTDLTTTP